MTEHRYQENNKSHHGFVCLLVLAGLKTLLISLLAWLVLFTSLVIEFFCKRNEMAIESGQMIALNNRQFINNKSGIIAKFFIRYLDKINEILNQVLTYIDAISVHYLQIVVHIFVTVTEIYFSRLFIFIMALPLLILILFVSITDGLVKRDIRKFKGARESALIFHRIKSMSGYCFFASFFIFMSTPLDIPPMLILLPQILLFGGMTALSITYFKKYL